MSMNQSASNAGARVALVKDGLILVWIVFLSIIALLAIGGNISRVAAGLSGLVARGVSTAERSSGLYRGSCKTDQNPNPTDYLNCYISSSYADKFRDEVPPIGSVLDSLQVNTSWRKPDRQLPPTEYIILFQIIENQLKALSVSDLRDRPIGAMTINNEILPQIFRGEQFMPKEILMPPEVQNWIVMEGNHRQRLRLVDTFGLLVMLGGLGSMIFLIREHIDPQKDIPIKNYVYKPLFGVLLAIATFVVSASANGVASRSRVEDLRTETILIFAFAAGLLSDQTYERLTKAAHRERPPSDDLPPPSA